jgi:threonine synthase
MKVEMRCSECGKTHSANEMIYRCEKCDYPLEIKYDYDFIASTMGKRLTDIERGTIWQYKELLPVADTSKIITMDEGGTPLHKATRLAQRLSVKNLYLKDETRNPTGSFKDRGSSVGVSKALEISARAVGCVSTGNMAASVAAYAAKAGIKSVVLIPPDTPSQKIGPIAIYGAEVMSIEKPYSEIYKIGLEMSQKFGIYWLHSDAPVRIEGQKTCAYEMWQQLGRISPDRVIIPTSSGGNTSALWKGWQELYKIGVVKKLPSMVVIQAEGCCPIAKAFKEGKEDVDPFGKTKTIAHSISNPDPPSGRRVLRLLKESNGIAEAVPDKELLEAQRLLAETEGIFAELAGAASVAGLKKLLEKGILGGDENIVCVVTGTGLKDARSAAIAYHKITRLKSWVEYQKLLETIKKS